MQDIKIYKIKPDEERIKKSPIHLLVYEFLEQDKNDGDELKKAIKIELKKRIGFAHSLFFLPLNLFFNIFFTTYFVPEFFDQFELTNSDILRSLLASSIIYAICFGILYLFGPSFWNLGIIIIPGIIVYKTGKSYIQYIRG